jgi:hypothetical protein
VSGPRKPKDIDRYVPAEEAARQLRNFAETITHEAPGVLIKWELQIRRWDPDWERRPHVVKGYTAGNQPEESK